MAEIPTFQPTVAGTPPTMAAAANGDVAPVGSGYVLIVHNGDGTSKTVTMAVPGDLETGVAYPDKAYTVAAGADAWIPLIRKYADPTDGKAHITYSALTSVTRAVVKI
jgi:hypothetical protein